MKPTPFRRALSGFDLRPKRFEDGGNDEYWEFKLVIDGQTLLYYKESPVHGFDLGLE